MEAVVSSKFSGLELPEGAEVSEADNSLLVTKWNWSYRDCLLFQKSAQRFVTKNKKLSVFIFCNHPHVYTMGRGNERGVEGLREFDSQNESLPFEIFNIHRGGGITYHHPGQWIFYPIKHIKSSYTLDDHMCWILKSVAKVLKDSFHIENVLTAKKLMGIWIDKKKVASIGVGLNRFVSEHGLALNLYFDEKANLGMNSINPCGMNSEVYCSVSDFSKLGTGDALLSFHNKFLEAVVPSSVGEITCK